MALNALAAERSNIMAKRDVLVGADPEIFLKDSSGIISAIGVIPGDKKAPFRTSVGAVQVDNVLAEFNIVPARTKEEFVSNVSQTMRDLQSMLPNGVEFEIRASHNYSIDYLVGQHGAFEFGCVPDYNAYTGKRQVVTMTDPTLRSAGGHIHMGGSFVLRNKEAIVKALDYLIALPSVLLDDDNKRRGLYGQAGSYRPKPYGLEYRTPSNFWIRSTALMEWAYSQTIRASEEYGLVPEWEKLLPAEELRKAINTSDKGVAKEFSTIYGDLNVLMV